MVKRTKDVNYEGKTLVKRKRFRAGSPSKGTYIGPWAKYKDEHLFEK